MSCSSAVKKPTTPTTEISQPTIEVVEQKKVFSFKSSLSWVEKATDCANIVINDKDFQDEAVAKTSFDYSEDDGEKVLNKLLSHHCVARTYKTKNPWSKAVATTYRSNTEDMYFNRRKKRSIFAWVGTSCHECLHNVGYSHGDNSSVGKENSVNYWYGSLCTTHAKRLCK